MRNWYSFYDCDKRHLEEMRNDNRLILSYDEFNDVKYVHQKYVYDVLKDYQVELHGVTDITMDMATNFEEKWVRLVFHDEYGLGTDDKEEIKNGEWWYENYKVLGDRKKGGLYWIFNINKRMNKMGYDEFRECVKDCFEKLFIEEGKKTLQEIKEGKYNLD